MDDRKKIALVGKNKEIRVFVSRYLKDKYNYKILGMDDYLDQISRKLYYLSKDRNIKWEQRLRMYDAWQKIDPDIWVNHIIRRVRDSTMSIVVPDVRYLNEVKRLEDEGFLFIRILVPSTQVKYIKSLSMDTNPGAALYYEWFASDADTYVKAKYSIYIENRESGRRAIDRVMENLT